MSKLSFRARQVDYNKPLPIYLNNDLPDLQDFAAINRSVPQMPTGMEKDEEAEHHLQRALSAFQAFGVTSTNDYAIPTPKVEIMDASMYARIYQCECIKHSKQYIRIQPFSNDYDYPDYDADDADAAWVAEQRALLPADFSDDLTLFFETLMDCLEKATGFSAHVMSRDEAVLLLKKEAHNHNNEENEFVKRKLYRAKYDGGGGEEKERFVDAVYEYWRAKRVRCRHPLTPTVMTDKSGVVTAPNNPFLVFRRRTEKMQTRKNRKNEEHSYENMLILKRDLMRAQQILKLIKTRESTKKELLKLTLETFEKRYKCNDYDATITDSIKHSLKPSTTTNTNHNNHHHHHNQQQQHQNGHSLLHQLPAGFSLNSPQAVALLNQKLANHPAGAQLAQLLQANKLKLNYNSNVQQIKKDLFNAADSVNSSPSSSSSNNKRFKKDSTTTSNNKLANDNLLNIKLNQQIRLQQQQQSLNTSNKKLTVNTTATNLLQSNDANNKRLRIVRKLDNNNEKEATLATSENLRTENPPTTLQQQQQQQPSLSQLIDPRVLTELNDYKQYNEELRLHGFDNLDSILAETKNKLSTSCEKDGQWVFKRKEGCKYLAPSGSMFKNDAFDFFEVLNKMNKHEYLSNLVTKNQPNSSGEGTEETRVYTSSILENSQQQQPEHLRISSEKRSKQVRDMHYFYYGYAVSRHQRHLGLTRRRLGRGGRVVMDRFDPGLSDLLESTASNSSSSSGRKSGSSFESLSKFKTYYPIECFEENEEEPEGAGHEVPERRKRKLRLVDFGNEQFVSSDSSDEEEKREQESGKKHFDYKIFAAYQLGNANSSSSSSSRSSNPATSSSNNVTQEFTNHERLRDDEEPEEGEELFETENNDDILSELFNLGAVYDDTAATCFSSTNTLKLDLKSETTLNDQVGSSSRNASARADRATSTHLPDLRQALRALVLPPKPAPPPPPIDKNNNNNNSKKCQDGDEKMDMVCEMEMSEAVNQSLGSNLLASAAADSHVNSAISHHFEHHALKNTNSLLISSPPPLITTTAATTTVNNSHMFYSNSNATLTSSSSLPSSSTVSSSSSSPLSVSSNNSVTCSSAKLAAVVSAGASGPTTTVTVNGILSKSN